MHTLQVEEGTFKGYDGSELFFQTWTKSQPKAVILGIHGLGEHSDCYNNLAQGLAASPYQLIMSDLRGHGRSSGKRGVGTIDEYVRDINIFNSLVASRFSGLPKFFLAHSMGGLVLIKFLIRHGSMGSRGFVLSSPLLGVTVDIPPLKKKSANLLAILTPTLTLSNEIPFEHLTHDPKVIEYYESDHWRHDRISPKLYVEMMKDMDYVFAQSDKIQGPCLMQQSADDFVVSQKRGADFFDQLKMQDKELIIYRNFYHEVYNEIGREKVFADLIRWLENH